MLKKCASTSLVAGYDVPLMSVADANLFQRAFELAYFIHPYAHIALRIAESAVHKLEHTFGRQGKRAVYIPSGRRHGHESPMRPLRTKVSLREEHLLQVLVYTESEQWERSSEQGKSHSVTQEDMVIRFIKHLMQITVRRNSFYVTLGLGRLLHEYNTSQVRQMYDVLMQDHARFRDNSYLRRQKHLLMRELLQRFDRVIRTITTAQREERFQTQPTTEPLLRLVRECLVRFTPWDTACVFPEKFDPVDKIPALAFSGRDPDDESPVEINRIHTLADPDCFFRLVTSLGFPPPDQMLAVPQFFLAEDNEPPGDRFNPPPVPEGQEDQLKTSLAERARRRKTFRPTVLRVYVDDIEVASFNPAQAPTVNFKIPGTANVIEVRGQDAEGELALGTLVVPSEEMPAGSLLKDSLTIEGGQKLSVVLRSEQSEKTDEFREIDVEIRYTETNPWRAIAWWFRRGDGRTTDERTSENREPRRFKPAYAWLLLIGAVAIVALLFLWQQRRPRDIVTPDRRVETIPTPAPQISPEPAPIRSPERPPTPPVIRNLIAQVAWSSDPSAVDRAIRLEVRRGGSPTIEVSDPARLLLAVNRADANGERYGRYRIMLIASDQTLWEQTLRAPARTTGRVNVLNLELNTRQLPAGAAYKLRVDGETGSGWENLGEIILTPKRR